MNRSLTVLLQPPFPGLSALMGKDKRFLKGAKRTPVNAGFYELLPTLLGVSADASACSFAGVSAVGEGVLEEKAIWLRADPVSFRADLARLYLLGQKQLLLMPEETQELIKVINEYIEPNKMYLAAPHPLRWYLRCEQIPKIRTYDPTVVIGKSIEDYLLSGEEQEKWLKLFTEIQMLLHQSPINHQRFQRKAPEVSALWFWGEKQLGFHKPPACDWKMVFTNHMMVSGLAKLNHIPQSPVIAIDAILNLISKNSGNFLLCIDFLDEINPIDVILNQLNIALKQKKITHLRLYPGDGYCYDSLLCGKSKWWKLIRKRKSV